MKATDVEIRPLIALEEPDLVRLASGYETRHRLRVDVDADAGTGAIRWRFGLEELAEPFRKRFDPPDDETLARYRSALPQGFCFGAWRESRLVGIALAEAQPWNRSLWVWELHVEAASRGLGLGRALVDALVVAARQAGLRTVVCETQNTNAPALEFYRRTGFRLEGVDLSYYSNEDHPDGEIALFMKRRID